MFFRDKATLRFISPITHSAREKIEIRLKVGWNKWFKSAGWDNFFVVETSVEESEGLLQKKIFLDKSKKHRAGMIGLEGKLWVSERCEKARCSNKQGATASFPSAPVSGSTWLQKSHKYEIFIWIHAAFWDFLAMPLNKKVKLLAQEVPELQTSVGWSLHWRLMHPLLWSKPRALARGRGWLLGVDLHTESSLTCYFPILSYTSLFSFIDSRLA